MAALDTVGLVTFSNITSTGFIASLNGTTIDTVTSSYNNDTADGFLYVYNGVMYDVKQTSTTIHTGTQVIHKQSVASANWTITHKLGHLATINVVVDHNSSIVPIYPNTVNQTSTETHIGFTTAKMGIARLV